MASGHAPAAYVEATTTRDVPVIMTHENQLPFPLRSAPPSSPAERGAFGWAASAGQGSDLDQVAGEYPVPAPDRRSVSAVQPSAVPAVTAFETSADPAFASGLPIDQLTEAAAVLDGLAGG